MRWRADRPMRLAPATVRDYRELARRRLLDVVKMLALGARAVLIGRAWAWAVAARGEAGVSHVLESFRADIDVALGLTGQTSARGLDRSALYEPETGPT